MSHRARRIVSVLIFLDVTVAWLDLQVFWFASNVRLYIVGAALLLAWLLAVARWYLDQKLREIDARWAVRNVDRWSDH